ncbi:right-handed parallel beta-helix repeat-containing protein [Herbaspirillum sp. GCM10030257]|uniref:right-handed parallel beta-helix repeat-containing protein n=1 Tax=Herbaspirillum sp. GCM10030257 TaxID=3273393 RepID=UPI00361A19B2
MPYDTIPFPLKRMTLALLLTIGLAACGGGSSSPEAQSKVALQDGLSASTTTATNTQLPGISQLPTSPTVTPPDAVGASDTQVGSDSPTPVAPSASLPVLAMPSTVSDNSVVDLQCGRTYQGTLDLKGKTNVTVRTTGACGNATLTPGQSLSGWTQVQGNIYSAPVSFEVAQVIIDGAPVSAAHWPNRTQTWAKASSSNTSGLTYAMPNADLTGATLVFKPYEWAVEARKITGYSGSTMAVASTGNINFDGYQLGGQVDFYVEGKLWMLDEPGEWAVSNGRLYVWAPDGQSPEGRIWAAPDKDAIDASNSRNVTIQNVSIFGAANGINGLDASKLSASAVRIENSSGNGILNSGGTGLTVDSAIIRNSKHDAIAVKWGGGGELISNSVIDASGTVSMPTNAHAAINLTGGSGAVVQNNRVTNSGYIGIRVFRNARVSGNTVDGACNVLTDCGGIFTSAPDKLALNTTIENNVIRNVAVNQRLAWGIYLGDFANGTTVAGNHVNANANGMEILNGYDNVIKDNTFTQSTQAHVQIVEAGTAAVVKNNAFSGNRFVTSGKQENYRISSDLGTSAVPRFGSYSANVYTSSSSIFANFNGEALNFTQWKTRTGQDSNSTLN